jgi:thioredoxin reductase (NADPH)
MSLIHVRDQPSERQGLRVVENLRDHRIGEDGLGGGPGDCATCRVSIETCDVLIVGTGPVGLFAVFQLGLLGLTAVLVDTLDQAGGQCAELYPEKPIYDIPSWPRITAQGLVEKLMEQISPFEPKFLLGRRVERLWRQPDGRFRSETSSGEFIDSAAVFVAAGAGSFAPRRPKLEGLGIFEGRSVFYSVRKRAEFAKHDVVVAGGGDSALDWTLNLLDDARSITLVHRSDRFRAAPHSIQAMQQAVAAGRMKFVQGELGSLHGEDGHLQRITLKTAGGEKTITADRLLAFFGLNIELGPIVDWALDLQEGKQIKVDTEAFQTSTQGIFAIGDINWYPGKLKLILSGFHEAALAAQAAFKLARPGEKLRFQYTTSSTELQKRLKVA